MKIFGLAAYYHDSSATLVVDGEIIAAAQEERFTRKKQDSGFPLQAINFCLKQSGLQAKDIDAIVFYEKPFLKFERLLETYVQYAPFGFRSFIKSIPLWLNEKLFQKRLLANELEELGFSKAQTRQILFSEHHLSHAASAFFASPFNEAVVLTMDGVGEWDTTTVYHGQGNRLKKIKEIHFPHSLGLLYSAFTYYCGFKVNSGEYKLMGLAPYGKPIYVDRIKKHLIDILEDGSYRLNMEYFDYCVGMTMTNKKFDRLFDGNFRKAEQPLLQVHMNLAASIQAVTEEVVLKMTSSLSKTFKTKNLCLAGGVALNCVANGKIEEAGLFENIWVQPAAGDAGGSLGAALAVEYIHLKGERKIQKPDAMKNAYLGPSFDEDEAIKALLNIGAKFEKLNEANLLDQAADFLADQKAIGWFQGRMEFGPRALGNRSILADSRSIEMQKNLNLKVKFRESFRPFAPVILEEDASKWFDFKGASPYMLMVAGLKQEHRIQLSEKQRGLFGIDLLNIAKSKLAAITHVDYSARLQTVNNESNPLLYGLIEKFKQKTGVGVLVNTSFNIRGEPIVCTVEDAYRCFMGTDLDVLVIGQLVLHKSQQSKESVSDYRSQFELD